jgi:hypothetical protein
MIGSAISVLKTEKIGLTIFASLLFFPTLAAQSGSEISGTVVDARGGQALSNVEVQLVGTAHRTASDAGGHFRMTNIAPGDYDLNASTIGYWLVTTHFHLEIGEIKEFEVILSAETLRRVDTVFVPSGSVFEPASQDAPTGFSLTGNDVTNLSGVLAGDPLRAVQALPGVSSDDDFEARFSLRGADFSRIGVYLDGILLHKPFHTIETRGGSGSTAALNGDLIERLDLYEGAYPVRFGDRSAGVLDVRLRDGSRDRYSFRISASFGNASAMAEGPLGKVKQCSWIAGFRKSYLQYLLARTASPSPEFGIGDGQGRLSCNATGKNNISLNIIDSYTDFDQSSVKEKLGINSLLLGGYHFTFSDLAWRYTPSDRVLITNRAAWMREKFEDRNPNQSPLGRGDYGEWVWDSTVAWMWNSRNPLNAGMNVRAIRGAGSAEQYNSAAVVRVRGAYDATGTLAGGFLAQSWSLLSGRMNLSAGGRWDHHSIDGVTAFSPQTSFSFSPLSSMSLRLGWGQYVQYPEISQLTSNLGSRDLLPMRSTQMIGAVEQRIGHRARVRAEFYNRQDRDLPYQPFYNPRLVNGKVFVPPLNPLYENSLRGYARGVEILLQRVSANGLNGWVSYAYGRTWLRDRVTTVSFPSDWDQRHTINAYGSYRVRPSVNLSFRWTYGSGFPIPGFLERNRALYFLSNQRNRLRLGPYQRADFRINKSWTQVNWKITLYGEVLNLTNKTNYRFDSFNGYSPKTAQAFLTLDKMFPILPSLGIVFER